MMSAKTKELCKNCNHIWTHHTRNNDGPCNEESFTGIPCNCPHFFDKNYKVQDRERKVEEIAKLDKLLETNNLPKDLIDKIESRIEILELSGNDPYDHGEMSYAMLLSRVLHFKDKK